MKLQNIQFEGIDHRDYPDYVDSYISYAEHENGVELTEIEYEELNDDRDYVYELLMNYLY